MPHIVWLCEFPTLNGGEYSLLSTLPSIREAGFRVTALAPPDGPLAERLHDDGVEIVPFSVRDEQGQYRGSESLRRELAARLTALRAELLHANSLSMGRLSGPVAYELGLPSLAHLRDIVRLSRPAVGDLNQHRRLLAVSQATRDFHLAQGVRAELVEVLYNGVDLERFRPRPRSADWRDSLGIPPEAYCIASVGQIVMRKGHDVLAAAAVRVASELPQAHFVMVGARYSEKPEARQFERDVQATFAAGLAKRVHWLGVRTDVPAILNECDLLVHTARQEPLGRVLLEAAASGLPVVATDVGGTREIFPGPALARIVAAGDADALAAAMVDLARHPDAARSLAERARAEIERRFDRRLAGAGLVRHYRQLLAEWEPS